MIYRGRCKEEDTQQLLDMLDEVFFSDDDEKTKRNFLELLPKLYKDKYHPAYNNFIVAEDGVIKAAVGLYPFEMNILGKKIKVAGIGNVGVAASARHKGYMIDCMNQCLDQMKADGTDISLLGGHRQRYGYFGYEPIGSCYRFTIGRRNIAHIKGGEYVTSFVSKKLLPEDKEDLRLIKELHEKSGIYAERPEEDLFDILSSWRNEPYSVYCNDVFAGYFVKDKFNDGCDELTAVRTEDMIDVILCALDTIDKEYINIDVPSYDTETLDYMMRYYDSCSYGHCEMVNVLNYRNFIEAFLGVKASRLNLGSGSLNLLIHGFRTDEQLKVTVEGKSVTVEETSESPDIELGHADAMRFVSAIFSRERTALPAFAQNWFPVDFCCFSADNV